MDTTISNRCNVKQVLCVKCSKHATLCGADSKNAHYCRPCYVEMVKHKFGSAIGKRRLYKDGEKRETLIVYQGNSSSSFLLWIVGEGLRADAHKRLTLIPTMLVLITVTERDKIRRVLDHVESIKEIIPCRWICLHMASVFEDLKICDPSPDSILTAQADEKWNSLMQSCKTETVRKELRNLCRLHICVRLAKALEITKVMLPDSANYMATNSLSSFVLGRGSTIHQEVDVVDNFSKNVSIVRPLKCLSRKEIALANWFSKSDRYNLYLDSVRNVVEDSIHALSDKFIDTLLLDGYSSSVNSILQTFTKLQRPKSIATSQCALCLTKFETETSEKRFCFPCNSLCEDVSDKNLLNELCSMISKTYAQQNA